MSLIKLSPDQLNEIASAVFNKIQAPKPPVTPEPEEDTDKVIYLDESVKVVDEVEQDLIKTLPRGLKAYKGKNGTQVINHTVESINFINDWKRNRKNMFTRSIVK